MTAPEMARLVRDCYAAFNVAPPADDSRAVQLWAELCAAVPLRAASFIRARIIDQETLPRNFGKAALNIYLDWKEKHGPAASAQAPCPNCDARLPGFFYTWARREDGSLRQAVCRCPCNTDKAWAAMPAMTKPQAVALGLHTLPPGATNLPAFERDLRARVKAEAEAAFTGWKGEPSGGWKEDAPGRPKGAGDTGGRFCASLLRRMDGPRAYCEPVTGISEDGV